jgi:WD40 repeat protein/transcriptional regulator with XRE-family HTH domain
MKRYSYGERDYAFGQRMQTLRTTIGLTQAGLADLMGVSRRAVETWEAGSSYPKAHHLKALLTLCVQQQAFPPGREEEEIRALWQAAHQKVLLDKFWLAALLHQPSAPPTPVPIEESGGAEEGSAPPAAATDSTRALPPGQPAPLLEPLASRAPTASGPRLDWGDALEVPSFYGRQEELATLAQWIVQERCRMVSVLGMGGIGKSALVTSAMRQLASHFQVVLFRSLRDAPSCEALLEDCLQVLSPQPLDVGTADLQRRPGLLLEELREQRVLLVLDNLEVLLQEGDVLGHLRGGYEDYGRLLEQVAQTGHQSCLLLTSREKPADLRALEGSRTPVRALRLAGLEAAACEYLLMEHEVMGSPDERARLVQAYSGNPLALRIVAETIADLFGGEISQFLSGDTTIFGSITDLLDEQWARLSPLEQTVLFWLAILREPVTLEDLRAVLMAPLAHVQVLEAVDGLRRRSLIERGQRAGSFTLQSVVLEEVTSRLVTTASQEIEQGRLSLLIQHGLEQAQAKDYVRQAQVRLLVRPLLERLRAELGQEALVEEHLLHLLNQFRGEDATTQGYGPSNVLSLLKELRGNLCRLDLSRLVIRDAYLQGVEMQDAILVKAHLHDVVFTNAFDAVLSVAVSPDGRDWAAGSNSGEVRVWREEGRTPQLVLRAHTDRVGSVTFSPDGRILATASWDGTIKLWDLASGAAIRALREHDMSVTSIVFSPSGELLASSSYDGTVRIWNMQNGTWLNTLHVHSEPILTVTWSLDGRLLASGGFDQTIRIWDAEHGALLHELRGHRGYVTDVAFALGDTMLASSSFDSTIKLWEVKTGTCLRTFEGHTGAVSTVAWSSDGRTVASGGYDATIRLWDRESGQCRSILKGHTGLVLSLTFTPGGEMLLSGSYDRTLRLWESASGQCLRILQGYAVSLFTVAWSPDGGYLADGSSDAILILWSLHERTAVRVLRGHTRCVNGVAWSRDGGLLASSSDDQTVRVWDVQTGACVRTLQGHMNLVNGLSWHPDGSLLASGSTDQTVCVWDVQKGVSLWTGSEHTGTVTSVAWHPNGTHLASSCEDHTVLVWQAEQGRALLRLLGHRGPVYDVVWSPDGTRLASCGGSGRKGELFVWDAMRGALVRKLEGHNSPVFSVAWSFDGTLLVSGGTDGALRWWDVEQGVCFATVQAHEGWVHSIQVSPDGETVASCGEDGAIRLWDLERGKHLRTLRRDRPYERLNITGIRGLTQAQKATLRALGAVEDAAVDSP